MKFHGASMVVSVILSIFILFSSITAWANYSIPRGCIAVFQGTKPISIEVDLPKFEGGIFQTKQFQFTNLPKNMTPDNQGRFCYPMDDERFAFVHVYYYAVKEIEDYNQIFTKLGLPLGKILKETVAKEIGFPSFGATYIDKGTISYPGTPADPSIIHHELGHWVRDNAVGRLNDPGDILAQSSADFLATLHSGNTFIGKYEIPASSYDINTFIHISDYLITRKQSLEGMSQDPIFAARFPVPYAEVKRVLDMAKTDPEIAKYLNSPDPDLNASAINQPLWQAAMLYGVEPIKLIYVKMLAAFNEDRNYSFLEIANALIRNANEVNPELGTYLEKEFAFRGIFNTNQPLMMKSQGCRVANFLTKSSKLLSTKK